MRKIIVDENMSAELCDVTQPVEICDATGQVLGRYFPAGASDADDYSRRDAAAPLDPSSFTTRDVLPDLERPDLHAPGPSERQFPSLVKKSRALDRQLLWIGLWAAEGPVMSVLLAGNINTVDMYYQIVVGIVAGLAGGLLGEKLAGRATGARLVLFWAFYWAIFWFVANFALFMVLSAWITLQGGRVEPLSQDWLVKPLAAMLISAAGVGALGGTFKARGEHFRGNHSAYR